MEITLVYKDVRYPYIFSYTDIYLPSTSYIAVSGGAVTNFHIYSSADGWNPSPSATNLGLIGFNYSYVAGFNYGDTFEIVTSAGTLTAADYVPITPVVPYLNWGPLPGYVRIYNTFGSSQQVYLESIEYVEFNIVNKLAIFVDPYTIGFYNYPACPECNIEYIDNLSSYPGISAIDIRQNTTDLKELNLSNMGSLLEVRLTGTQGLSAINLTNSVNVKKFEIFYDNSIKDLNLSNLTNLEYVQFLNTSNLSAFTISPTNNISFLGTFNTSFASSYVDNILINLNNNSVYNGIVSIGDFNSPRTNASDAAVAGLSAKGWTVLVNHPV